MSVRMQVMFANLTLWMGARRVGLRVLLCAFLAGAGWGRLHAAEMSDAFADRPTFTDPTGDITGSTANASREIDEPVHGGKTGGKSVWMTWVAPENGIVTFHTDGSAFDTLLSAYEISTGNGPILKRLQEEARNDDGPLPPASFIQFGAIAGRRYEIALDGRNNSGGAYRLRWEFDAVSKPPPVILHTPSDQALKLGDRLELSVDLIEGDSMKLSWFLNEDEILNEESSTLIIPNLDVSNLGIYRLRIRLGSIKYFSAPIEIQINSEGATNALARNKILDSVESKFEPNEDGRGGGPRLQDVGAGNTRGFNGTQIFNTFYATRDPAEPIHCGIGGGSSYWFTYSPPADGQVYLNTVGSSYDTVLAVYTFTPPLTGYQDLLEIACNNDGAGIGTASEVDFAALAGHNYVIVIDGVLGAKGLAHLNYRVDITQPPVPPIVQSAPPASETVYPGTDVRLEVAAAGSPPLHFRWWKGNTLLSGMTNATLLLPRFQASDAGDYSLTVSSHIGETNTSPITLLLPVTPSIKISLLPQSMLFELYVPAGTQCQLEYRDSLTEGDWLPAGDPVPGADQPQSISLPRPDAVSRFYRIRP